MSTTALMSFFPFVYEQPKSMYMYVCVEFTVYICLQYSTDKYVQHRAVWQISNKKKTKAHFTCLYVRFSSSSKSIFSLQQLCYNVHLCVIIIAFSIHIVSGVLNKYLKKNITVSFFVCAFFVCTLVFFSSYNSTE